MARARHRGAPRSANLNNHPPILTRRLTMSKRQNAPPFRTPRKNRASQRGKATPTIQGHFSSRGGTAEKLRISNFAIQWRPSTPRSLRRFFNRGGTPGLAQIGASAIPDEPFRYWSY